MKPPKEVVPANDQWPAEKVRQLAGESGKPLEVACAVTFIAGGWEAWLGAHFEDSGRIRELDVFVEKSTIVPAAHTLGAICTSRVLISCKGFPPHCSPLTYSLSRQSVPELEPMLIASELALPSPHPGGSPEFVEEIQALGAARLLEKLDLGASSRVVGFDTIERRVARDSTVTLARARDGDHPIHAAIDSALKAALYWNDRRPTFWSGGTQPRVVLHVPLCVISVPMWDVEIDDGRVGKARVHELAFQTNFYPLGRGGRHITTVLVTPKTLDKVIGALDAMHAWLCELVVARYPSDGSKGSDRSNM